jgi:2-C-methyl-D-erythritol 4-phosphate cytidylyltransferase
MNNKPQLGAIIVAAGKSERMNGIDKIFAPLKNKTLLEWSVDTCQKCQLVQQIIIILDKNKLQAGQELREKKGWTKVTAICAGGHRRQDSVIEGLNRLSSCDWVMVHDGARPFLSISLIQRGIETAIQNKGAAIAAIPVRDTIKLTNNTRVVVDTLPRNLLWAVQTPQIFSFKLITRAYEELTGEVTDDAHAVEHLGYSVKIFFGSYDNIKVTTKVDLISAEVIAQAMASEP